MKKFAFALDSLRRYRNTLFEQEQARLQSLLFEFKKLEDRRVLLLAEVEQSRHRIQTMSIVPVDQLTALQAFRRYADEEAKRIAQMKTSLSGRIDQQKLALRLARRNVEALEKLKERRFQTWRLEVDREMEATVAELVIARFKPLSET
jgi:flagellar export protein FliJ